MDKHIVRRALEEALSDFKWIEKNVPNSNFHGTILLLEVALKEMDK